ncbi:NCS2 family permease, partial [bacterium]|nr:NCS2 family permease [bacterium]
MKPRWFVRGDLDGWAGLFIDNLIQLLLIISLVPPVCGIPSEIVLTRMLPAAALSILVGNLFYSWQAHRLAQGTGRSDVTALPFGINTVSLVAYLFLIMGPLWQKTHDADLVWAAGIFACSAGGLLELLGAFVTDPLRRWLPRAALLSPLAGIALTFISMPFVFKIYAQP